MAHRPARLAYMRRCPLPGCGREYLCSLFDRKDLEQSSCLVWFCVPECGGAWCSGCYTWYKGPTASAKAHDCVRGCLQREAARHGLRWAGVHLDRRDWEKWDELDQKGRFSGGVLPMLKGVDHRTVHTTAWPCPVCKTHNPAGQLTCRNCGADAANMVAVVSTAAHASSSSSSASAREAGTRVLAEEREMAAVMEASAREAREAGTRVLAEEREMAAVMEASARASSSSSLAPAREAGTRVLAEEREMAAVMEASAREAGTRVLAEEREMAAVMEASARGDTDPEERTRAATPAGAAAAAGGDTDAALQRLLYDSAASWQCTSWQCKACTYKNPAGCGVCGMCGGS